MIWRRSRELDLPRQLQLMVVTTVVPREVVKALGRGARLVGDGERLLVFNPDWGRWVLMIETWWWWRVRRRWWAWGWRRIGGQGIRRWRRGNGFNQH